MLGKLIKHEFKATARIFLFVYIALIVISAINMIVVPWEFVGDTSTGIVATGSVLSNFLKGITGFMYMIVVAATAVVTLIVNISRYYKNLMGDEGYLMFTLPVSKESLVISKLIVGFVWNICSFVLICLSLLMLFGRYDLFGGLRSSLAMAEFMGINIGVWITMIIVILLTTTIANLLMLYAAISIGPNVIKNRLGGSIIAYIIIYVIVQIVATAMIAILGVIINGNTTLFNVELSTLSDIQGLNFAFYLIVGVGIVMNVIVIAACYIITRRMLNKKLNLA